MNKDEVHKNTNTPVNSGWQTIKNESQLMNQIYKDEFLPMSF